MGHSAVPDGRDALGPTGQFVPSMAAMIDDLVVGVEDVRGEPVITHELSGIFDGIALWTFRWQRDDVDVSNEDERNGSSEFGTMQVHRVGRAERWGKPGTATQGGAYRPKHTGRCCSLIMRCRWACSALRPPAHDLLFLTYARLVVDPSFYHSAVREACANLFQFGCKALFIKAFRA
jgi:hypothetical protein